MPSTQRHWLHSEADTHAFAASLAPLLRAGDVIALVGDLGAGKTAFVRGLASALGLEEGERVSSPSYALVNEYALANPQGGAAWLAHLDLYRISDEDELEGLGWRDLVEGAIVAVEWPERAPLVLAQARFILHFEISEGDRRHLTVEQRA